MAENIDIKFGISGLKETEKDVKSLEKSLLDLEKEYDELKNISFGGKTQKEVDTIKMKMSGLKKEMADYGALEASMGKGNTFRNIAGSIGIASGAMAGLTGAMTLVGSENTKMNELMQKTVGLLGVSAAMQQISEGLESNYYLNSVKRMTKRISLRMTENLTIKSITNSSKIARVAQLLWNKSVAANPIGAIVLLVAALAAGIYLLTKRYKENNTSTLDAAKASKEYKEAVSASIAENSKEITTLYTLKEGTVEYKDALVDLSIKYKDYLSDTEEATLINGKLSDSVDVLVAAYIKVAEEKGIITMIDKTTAAYVEANKKIKEYYVDHKKFLTQDQGKSEEAADAEIKRLEDLGVANKGTLNELAELYKARDKEEKQLRVYSKALININKNTKGLSKELQNQIEVEIDSANAIENLEDRLSALNDIEVKYSKELVAAIDLEVKRKESVDATTLSLKNKQKAESDALKSESANISKKIENEKALAEETLEYATSAQKYEKKAKEDLKDFEHNLKQKKSLLEDFYEREENLDTGDIDTVDIDATKAAISDLTEEIKKTEKEIEDKKDYMDYLGFSKVEYDEHIENIKNYYIELKEIQNKINETNLSTELTEFEIISIENIHTMDKGIKALEVYRDELIALKSESPEVQVEINKLDEAIIKSIENDIKAAEAKAKLTKIREADNKAIKEEIKNLKDLKEEQIELMNIQDAQLKQDYFGNLFDYEDAKDAFGKLKKEVIDYYEVAETTLGKIGELGVKIGAEEDPEKREALKGQLDDKTKLYEEQLGTATDMEGEYFDKLSNLTAEKDAQRAELRASIEQGVYDTAMAWTARMYEDKMDLMNAQYEEEADRLQKSTDTKNDIIQTQLDEGIISEERATFLRDQIATKAAEKQEKIAEDRAKKERALIRKQAVYERGIALATIAYETAKGIIHYSAGLPYTAPLLVGVIAAGAVQASAVLAQPLPKAETGGRIVGQPHSLGGVNINAEDGEFIINKYAMSNPVNSMMVEIINSSSNNNMGMEILVTNIVNQVTSIPVIVTERDITSTQRVVRVAEDKSKFF